MQRRPSLIQSLLPGYLSLQSSPEYGRDTLNDTIQTAEAIAIMDALKHNSYNRNAAAQELGMHKSTLFRKIKKLGITLPEIDGRSGPKTRT